MTKSQHYVRQKSNKQSLTPLSNFNDQINFPVAVRVYESGVKLAWTKINYLQSVGFIYNYTT